MTSIASPTAWLRKVKQGKIHETTGDLYVLAGLKSHQPAHELLLDKMSERVTVTGTLVKGKTAQMLYIDAVR